MVRTGVCLGLLCMSLGALPLPAVADGSRSGKIERARERMRESSRPDDSDDDDDGGGSSLLDDDDNDDEANPLEQAAGKLLFYALAAPFWAPQLIIGDRDPHRRYDLQPYPYAGTSEGPFRLLRLNEQGEPYEITPLQVSLRAMASYERLGDNLDGRRLRLTLRTNARLGLDAGITRYTERLGDEDQDALWHYHALATVAFAVSPRAQFTFGVGARGIHFLAGDSYTHIAAHYAAELFPVKPFHAWILGEASFWTGTWTTEVEAGLGVLVERLEIFGGYRQFRITGVEFAGPEVGVMAWF
jgi:hypothetical protein